MPDVISNTSPLQYLHQVDLLSGTLGILLLAKERDLLKTLKPVLDHLQKLGFRLDDGTRRIVLSR